MTITTIQFDAHCGTVAFWRGAAKSFGARSWKGAMRAFAAPESNGAAMGDDSALVMSFNGRERRIAKGSVVWRGKPSIAKES